MSSLRQRTLWRVMLLLLVGSGLLALYNYHDSRHEINEVYDAHLAQNARLLQGIMSLPVQEQSRDELYRAFDEALSKAGHHKVGHRYESKLAFQVWADDGGLLVHTPSAPQLGRRRGCRVLPTWWWMGAVGAVLSCRCRKNTG